MDLKNTNKKIQNFFEKEIKKANWKRVLGVWIISFLILQLNSINTIISNGENLNLLRDFVAMFVLGIVYIFIFQITASKLCNSKVNFIKIAYSVGVCFFILSISAIIGGTTSLVLSILELIISIISIYLIYTVIKTTFSIGIGKTIILIIVVQNVFAIIGLLLGYLYFGWPYLLGMGPKYEYGAERINHSDGSFTIVTNHTLIGESTEICEIGFPAGWKNIPKNNSNKTYIDYKEFVNGEKELYFTYQFGISNGLEDCSDGNFSISYDDKKSQACGMRYVEHNKNIIKYVVNYNQIDGAGYLIVYTSPIGQDQDFYHIIDNTNCYEIKIGEN